MGGYAVCRRGSRNDTHWRTTPNPEATRRRAAVTAHGVCRNVAGIRRMPSPQPQKRRSLAHGAEPRSNAQPRCCYDTRRVPTTETPQAAELEIACGARLRVKELKDGGLLKPPSQHPHQTTGHERQYCRTWRRDLPRGNRCCGSRSPDRCCSG